MREAEGTGAPVIDLFVGELPEYVAEVRCVRRLIDALRSSGTSAVLFANIDVPSGQRGSRQLDLLLATDRGAWIVEVKGFRRPFEGSLDGEWWLLDREGRPSRRLTRNPVRQAGSQRFALCDRIGRSVAWRKAAVGGDVRDLVDAVVCSYPDIPARSRVPSPSGRVSVVCFEELLAIVQRSRTTRALPLGSWRDLGTEWRLRRIAGPLPEGDEEIGSWELLDSYIASVAEWGTALERRVDTPLRASGQRIEAMALFDALGDGRPVALVGESGTGKSLLARYLAARGVTAGLVPIIVEAKYFDGSLRRVVDEALRRHGDVGVTVLRDGARRGGLLPLVVLDGLNECPEPEAPRLVRAVVALARRERVALLVTTRLTPHELVSEGFLVVELVLPTEEERHAIATLRAPQGAPPHVMELLASMRTPRDITVAAELTDDLSAGATLHDVYHAFSSRRLGRDDVGRAAFEVLCAAAAGMAGALRWTLRVSELARLEPALPEDRLLVRGVMERRGETCAFAHETVLRFFLLESLLRKTKGDRGRVAELLRRPRFRSLTSLAVCAIEEPDVLDLLLGEASEASVIADALMGRLGRAAKRAAGRRVDSTLAEHQRHRAAWRIRKFDVSGARVRRTLERPSPLSPAAEHTMGALGVVVRRGIRVDDVFALIESADRRCRELLHESREEGALDHDTDTHFRALWLFEGREKHLLGREIDDRPDARLLRAATARLSDVRGQPPGVLAFLCNVVSSASADTEQFWVDLCEACWASGCVHLQLSAVRLAHRILHVGKGAGVHRDALLDFLERGLGEDPFVNSEIFEALAYTGRIDPPVDDTTAVEQIASCLLGGRSPERCREASGVWARAHDDIFQGVYWNAIDELDDARRFEFRVRAVLGEDFPDPFLPVLLSHLIEANTPEAAVAFEKWARRPVDTFMPDAAAEAFCLAVVGLAKCGGSLPPHEGTGDRGAVWSAIGEILNAAHRAPGEGDLGSAGVAAWSELRSCEPLSAAMAIAEVRQARGKDLRIDWSDLTELASGQCALVLERAVQTYAASTERSTQGGGTCCSWRMTGIVGLLGETGADRAIDLLTSVSDHPELGTAAIGALRRLRERLE